MYVRWYLHEYIADVEDTDESVELLPRHVKILFEAFQPCRPVQTSATLIADLPRNTIRDVASVYLRALISIPV